MPGQLQNPQTTLNYLYDIFNAAVIALANPGADVTHYEIGDRTVSIRDYKDLESLQRLIRIYESAVTADVQVVPYMGGVSDVPGPWPVGGRDGWFLTGY